MAKVTYPQKVRPANLQQKAALNRLVSYKKHWIPSAEDAYSIVDTWQPECLELRVEEDHLLERDNKPPLKANEPQHIYRGNPIPAHKVAEHAKKGSAPLEEVGTHICEDCAPLPPDHPLRAVGNGGDKRWASTDRYKPPPLFTYRYQGDGIPARLKRNAMYGRQLNARIEKALDERKDKAYLFPADFRAEVDRLLAEEPEPRGFTAAEWLEIVKRNEQETAAMYAAGQTGGGEDL